LTFLLMLLVHDAPAIAPIPLLFMLVRFKQFECKGWPLLLSCLRETHTRTHCHSHRNQRVSGYILYTFEEYN
jgi:hypothetical protein